MTPTLSGGTITRLVYQKRNKQRVNVHLDGAFAFAVPEIEAARLKVGQPLSAAEVERLAGLGLAAKAYDKAVHFLGYRPRSQAEIEAHLQRAGYGAHTNAGVIERLQQQGYVDDKAFAAWWVDNRSQFNPRGEQALRHELRQKGIAPGIIDQVLGSLDETAQARAAAESRAERWRHLPHEDFYRRLMGYLQRRGFGYGVARQTTDLLWQETRGDS